MSLCSGAALANPDDESLSRRAPTRASSPRQRVHSYTLLLLGFFLGLGAQRSTPGFFLRRRVNRFPGDGIAEAGRRIELVIRSYDGKKKRKKSERKRVAMYILLN